jgi:hypothetical protein
MPPKRTSAKQQRLTPDNIIQGKIYANISFRPKGNILRHITHARRFVHNGDILRKVFWRISALVFQHY